MEAPSTPFIFSFIFGLSTCYCHLDYPQLDIRSETSGGYPLDIVGHRGARGEAPENTLAGFEHALRAGVREIELDVRLSSDAHLIVVHDAEVDRTTWHAGPVLHHSRTQLSGMDARRNTPGWHSPLAIPALSEVIELCPADTRFQFEIKTLDRVHQGTLAHNLKQLIDHYRLHERIVVTSSDQRLLRKVRLTEPQVALGLIAQYRFEQPLRRARALGCSWLIAHRNLVSRRLVRAVHKRSMRLSVWTVNDTQEAQRMAALGVDSLITDYPTRMLALFNEGEPAQPTSRKERISDERDMASR